MCNDKAVGLSFNASILGFLSGQNLDTAVGDNQFLRRNADSIKTDAFSEMPKQWPMPHVHEPGNYVLAQVTFYWRRGRGV